MNKVLLSFIIPIYNTEKYLGECFSSIEKQADSRCEIILVDDGSTDNSGELAEKLKEDSRLIVKVIHKVNGGLASARNSGLEIAQGKFLCFVDSDDKIADNCLVEILERIEKNDSDLFFMQAIKFYSDGKIEDLGDGITAADINGKSRKEIFRCLSKKDKYCGSACTKIYKREFLIENNLRFPLDTRFSEDLGFVRDAILLSKSFSAFDVPFYEYRQGRVGSITSGNLKKRFLGLKTFLDESIELLTTNKKANDEISGNFLNYVAYEYTIMMFLMAQMDKSHATECYVTLKNYKWVLRFAGGKRTRVIRMISRFLGVKLTANLICKIKKGS